jgi:hypothetical protein
MGWGKESAKNPQEMCGANAEITRGPPRGRERWRGARRVDPFCWTEIDLRMFFGGIFRDLFFYLFLFYLFSQE